MINVQADENNQYICQLSSPVESSANEIRCCGQSEEHAIANALEQLASQYRQITEERQNTDWEAVEYSAAGEPIQKRYHVILHYERIRKAESKFDALQDTLLGNTVVENAKVNLIEIDEKLPIQPVT
jgi:predicted component of type VI protein secretion system